MIKRKKYIDKIAGFYDSDLVKIITGIRRCGKSVLLNQIEKEISKKSDNIISLNFEDIEQTGDIKNYNDLINYVQNVKKDKLCYLFFDEIQNLKDWALAIRTLRLKNCSIFLSGSNSKLLSSEFIKELSGRHVSFRVKPFVYKEMKEYAEELNKSFDTNNYLIWGGFPKRIEFDSEDDQKQYIKDIEESIVYKDIIQRYSIRKVELFRQVTNFITMSNARIISQRSIYNFLQNNGIKCSQNTIIQYLQYLENAYIINKIKRYSNKVKRELEYYNKYYNEDVAFNSLKQKNNRYDITHNFENCIYNELVFMGYELNVYNVNDYEIDFIASKNGKLYYIQVAYSIVEESIYKREFKPFDIIDNQIKKIIISNDELDYSTSTVSHIKFKDFVLMNDLEN